MTPVHLLGIPHDEHSSFIRGAAEAPPAIRAELFSSAYNMWTETGIDLGGPGILVDEGDAVLDGSHDAWEEIEAAVLRVVQHGQPTICLGGDHAITHPIVRAFRKRYERLSILHFDAHPDLYENFEGDPRSHASPFARIMEERLVDRLVQVGVRAATGHQRDQWARYGVEVIEMRQMERALSAAPQGSLPWRFEAPVYISLDLDVLDPAHAPGVSHREPGGMSTRQVIDILHAIEGRIVGADIVEYNPRQDFAVVTATVAAKLLKEIAGTMITSARRPV